MKAKGKDQKTGKDQSFTLIYMTAFSKYFLLHGNDKDSMITAKLISFVHQIHILVISSTYG